jgi:hypothetical protein
MTLNPRDRDNRCWGQRALQRINLPLQGTFKWAVSFGELKCWKEIRRLSVKKPFASEKYEG